MMEAKLTATTFIDGKFTVDGQPFPYEVRSIEYKLTPGKYSFPTLLLELVFDKITIEHGKNE